MNDLGRIAVWALCQILIVTALWLAGVLVLRRINFMPRGERRTAPRGATDDIRAKQIEYHNTASYRAFEFFLKVALAILGGIAFLSVQANTVTPSKAEALIVSGAWLLLLSAVVFSAVVFIHQKSKIERWPQRYVWYQTLLWVEYWFVQGMLLVPVGLLVWAVPILVGRQ